jgi:hypothetical protein
MIAKYKVDFELDDQRMMLVLSNQTESGLREYCSSLEANNQMLQQTLTDHGLEIPTDARPVTQSANAIIPTVSSYLEVHVNQARRRKRKTTALDRTIHASAIQPVGSLVNNDQSQELYNNKGNSTKCLVGAEALADIVGDPQSMAVLERHSTTWNEAQRSAKEKQAAARLATQDHKKAKLAAAAQALAAEATAAVGGDGNAVNAVNAAGAGDAAADSGDDDAELTPEEAALAAKKAATVAKRRATIEAKKAAELAVWKQQWERERLEQEAAARNAAAE